MEAQEQSSWVSEQLLLEQVLGRCGGLAPLSLVPSPPTWLPSLLPQTQVPG